MNHADRPPDFTAAWAKFRAQRQPELDGWLEAERALAGSGETALAPGAQGERLLAAEAALQRAIVDFAAVETGESDPTAMALELLRLAEALLYHPEPPARAKRSKR
jgi:hypothetical protein